MCFEFKQLRYALAAAELGSFARAGDALDVAPSAVSRQVDQLETIFGCRLFERSRSGVTLTPAGERFFAPARRIFYNMQHLAGAMRASGEDIGPRLGVGFYTSLAVGHLRADIVEFARANPAVRLEPLEEERDQLIAALEAGTIDVAILTGSQPVDGLAHRALWSEKIFAALPEHHPLAARQPLHWLDLGDQNVLVSTRDPGPDISAILGSRLIHAVHQPKVTAYSVGLDALRALAAAGFGIALTPESSIGAQQQGLVYRELVDPQGPTPLRYCAYWMPENQGAGLATLLALFDARYPQPASH